VQALVGELTAGTRGRTSSVPAPPQRGPWTVAGTVMPGRLDQEPSGMAVAGPGNPALDPAGTMLGGTQVEHQRVEIRH